MTAEAVAMEASAALLAVACESALRRVWMTASGGHRSKAKEITWQVSALQGAEFTGSLRLSTVLDSLPAGLTLARVQSILAAPETRGSLHELVAVVLLDGDETVASLVEDNFARQIRKQAQNCNEVELDHFISVLFAELRRVITDARTSLEQGDRKALETLKTHASARLIQATLSAIAAHNDLLRAAHQSWDDETAAEWQSAYLRQVREAHGYIQPPDFERKRKLAYGDIYVPPKITRLQRSSRPDVLTLRQFSDQIDRTVLLGDPGFGKSTASGYIAYNCAAQQDGLVPFLIVLRDFTDRSQAGKSVVEYIESLLGWFYQVPPLPGYVTYLLATGRALVIFDGLDELLDTAFRREMTEIVELFACRYPLAPILVTSRRVGYEQAQLNVSEFASFLLTGFRPPEAREYAAKWFSQDDSVPAHERASTMDAFVAETEGLTDLTESPLMLSLICILYRGEGFIPRNRPDVYERCASLLFEKWDSSRRIHVELRAKSLVDPAIKHLAYWMFTSPAGGETVTEGELVSEVETLLEDAFEQKRDRHLAASEFVEFCRGRAWVLSDAGTTADGTALFRFTHRTFMEYFAAFELTRMADGPEELAKKLVPKVARGQWDVVAQLAVQIANKNSRNGADRVVNQLFKVRRTRTPAYRDINITAFCGSIAEVCVLPPRTVRELARRAYASCLEAYENSDRQGLLMGPLDKLFRITQESVAVAQDELRSLLLEDIASIDQEVRSRGRDMLTIELRASLMLTRDERLQQQWGNWLNGLVNEVGRGLLGDSPSSGIWSALYDAGVISFKEFVEDVASDEKYPLDPIVCETITSWLLGAAVPPAADIWLSEYGAPSGSRLFVMFAQRLHQSLRELSKLIDEQPDDTPLASPRFSMGPSDFIDTTIDRALEKARSERDPDIAWGVSVLAAIMVENLDDKFGDFARG